MQKTTQNILFCLLITALGILASSFSTVVDHMATTMGQPAASVGLYLSIFAAGSFASVPFGSVLADWLGKRKIVRFAIAILTTGITILAFSDKPGFLYAGIFLMGVGFGPTESMTSAFLADENPENPSRWMSFSQIGFGIGAVAAPIGVAVYLRDSSATFNSIFAFCAVIFIGLFTIVSLTGPKKSKVKSYKRLQINLFSVLKRRKLLVYALMIFCYLGFESTAPAYIKQLSLASGSGDTFSSLMISLFWASMILCRFIGTFFGGKELASIKVLCLVIITGIAVMLSARIHFLFVTGVCLFGFGCGSIWPMLVALAAKAFPERSGAACGIMMLFSTAGYTLFPVMIGTWVGNLRITFVLCAALAVCVFCGAFIAERAAEGDFSFTRNRR